MQGERITPTVKCALCFAPSAPLYNKTAARRYNRHKEFNRNRKRWDLFRRPSLFKTVNYGCGKDHQAEHDFLRLAADFHEVHAVLNDGDKQSAQQCSKHRALATRKGCAADDD